MQQQRHYPIFTATSYSVMMDGTPLTKFASRNLPPEMLCEIEGIEKLIKQVKKEEWDKPVLYAGGEYPPVVLAKMKAALLSPQPFSPDSSKSLAKAGFNPDEPRDERGRWTDSYGEPQETHIEHYEPVAYTTRRGSRGAPNRYVSAKDGVTEADLQNPRFNGMDNRQIKKQKFVDANLAATEKAANGLNVPVANILGVAALESGWGRGDFVVDGSNSFFGMATPAPFMNGSTQAADSEHLVAAFANYEDALKAFVAVKGNIIRNISDPQEFATAIQIKGKFGIDMTTGKFDPKYIPNLMGTIKGLSRPIAFARKNPK